MNTNTAKNLGIEIYRDHNNVWRAFDKKNNRPVRNGVMRLGGASTRSRLLKNLEQFLAGVSPIDFV